MENEQHDSIRQDIGYDLPEHELTLDEAKALYAQGLGGKKVEAMIQREKDRLFFDQQHGNDSSKPLPNAEDAERSKRGHALASEALRRAQEERKK